MTKRCRAPDYVSYVSGGAPASGHRGSFVFARPRRLDRWGVWREQPGGRAVGDPSRAVGAVEAPRAPSAGGTGGADGEGMRPFPAAPGGRGPRPPRSDGVAVSESKDNRKERGSHVPVQGPGDSEPEGRDGQDHDGGEPGRLPRDARQARPARRRGPAGGTSPHRSGGTRTSSR